MMYMKRNLGGVCILLLAGTLFLGGCWGRKFVQMPRETISASAKIDSLLRDNARLQRRVYHVEKTLVDQQQIDRNFNAQLKLDLEELKDRINALQQALAEMGVTSTYRYEPTPPRDEAAMVTDTTEAGGVEPGWEVTGGEPPGIDTTRVDATRVAADTAGVTADTSRSRVRIGESIPAPEEIHRQIYLDFSRRDYQLALEESDIFLEAYPDHPLGEEVRFIRGESFIEQQKYFDALNEFALILQQYPRGRKVPAALLRMAIAYEKIGEEEIAAGVVKRLRKEYPYSEEAAIAEERFQELLEE
jgi:tol-pal system protein YbgF